MQNRGSQWGFSFIELSLALAISSMLMITLMFGWGLAVNTQQYKDGVRTFQADIQARYTDTYATPIDRAKSYRCQPGGPGGQLDISTVAATAPSAVSRGASDCVVMGTFIQIDGKNVRVWPVVGLDATDQVRPDHESERTYIRDRFLPTAYELAEQTYTLPWDMRTYFPGAETTDAKQSILIIRSPETGQTLTLGATTVASETVMSMIDRGTEDVQVICLDPQAQVAQTRFALQIGERASAASAVRLVADEGATGC